MLEHIQHILSYLSHVDLSPYNKCYKNNHAYMYWSQSLTTKVMKYFGLHKNHIWECFHNKELEILHIYVKLNVSVIFTKELHDGGHFRTLKMC